MSEQPSSSRSTSLRWALLPILVLLAVSACASGSPGGTPTSGAPKSVQALKLDVLRAVGGHLSYCDPDQFPVANQDPIDSARQRLPMIKADGAAFDAILRFEHLTADQQLTDDQLIAINQDYKQMQAIQLVADGDEYPFDLQVPDAGSPAGAQRLTGTVTRSGSVTIEHREAGHRLPCPICLAMGVRIATPSGDVPVQDLKPGMPVWTVDRSGRRIVGVVRQTGHMQAPLGHQVIRIMLADGRTVVASPGHPTADGRTVGDLRPGDLLDGSRVVTAVPLPYSGRDTYDLLPSGSTGLYFANGVLLGSALAPTN